MLIKEVDRNPIDLSNRVRGFEPVNEDEYYKLPTRSDKRSAGYDFYSTETFTIQPNEFHTFKTNIKAYMKDDEYLAIHVRSSIGIKKNLILLTMIIRLMVVILLLACLIMARNHRPLRKATELHRVFLQNI